MPRIRHAWDTSAKDPMIQNFIIGILGICFGIAGFVHQISETQEVAALKREGQPLVGHIDGGSSRTKRGSTSYWLKVTYSVGGRPYKGGGDITQKVYDKYVAGGFYFSKEIPIRYLPSNPSVMRIADPDLPSDFNDPSIFHWFFAAGMSLLGVFCIKQAVNNFRSYLEKKQTSGI